MINLTFRDHYFSFSTLAGPLERDKSNEDQEPLFDFSDIIVELVGKVLMAVNKAKKGSTHIYSIPIFRKFYRQSKTKVPLKRNFRHRTFSGWVVDHPFNKNNPCSMIVEQGLSNRFDLVADR